MFTSKVRLTKLSNNKNALRTISVEGFIGKSLSNLKIGDNIVIVAEPLDKDKESRTVTTSPIQKIDLSKGLFTTLNSIYHLEEL